MSESSIHLATGLQPDSPGRVRMLAAVHEVRIEVPSDALPSTGDEVIELRGRLLEAADRCIDEHHAELSDVP